MRFHQDHRPRRRCAVPLHPSPLLNCSPSLSSPLLSSPLLSLLSPTLKQATPPPPAPLHAIETPYELHSKHPHKVIVAAADKEAAKKQKSAAQRSKTAVQSRAAKGQASLDELGPWADATRTVHPISKKVFFLPNIAHDKSCSYTAFMEHAGGESALTFGLGRGVPPRHPIIRGSPERQNIAECPTSKRQETLSYVACDMSACFHTFVEPAVANGTVRTGLTSVDHLLTAKYAAHSPFRWFLAGFLRVYMPIDTGDPRYKQPEELRRFIEDVWSKMNADEQARWIANGGPSDEGLKFVIGQLEEKAPGLLASWRQKPDGRRRVKELISMVLTEVGQHGELKHADILRRAVPGNLPHECTLIVHGVNVTDEYAALEVKHAHGPDGPKMTDAGRALVSRAHPRSPGLWLCCACGEWDVPLPPCRVRVCVPCEEVEEFL